jgi:hypothetical protein
MISAIKYLQYFLKFKDDDDKKFGKEYEGQIYQAKEMIKYAKKESELKKKIVPFEPKVVTGVSTKTDEYLAYISPDDKLCFFTRKVPLKSMNTVKALDGEKEVYMIANRDKTGVFNIGEPMSPPFNTTDDNKVAALFLLIINFYILPCNVKRVALNQIVIYMLAEMMMILGVRLVKLEPMSITLFIGILNQP